MQGYKILIIFLLITNLSYAFFRKKASPRPHDLLMDAIKSHDVAKIESALDNNPELASNIDDYFINALIFRVPLRVIQTFVEKGADVNCRYEYVSITRKLNGYTLVNQTPLLTAARVGNYEVINYLINAGADVDYKDEDGNTALHYAVTGDILYLSKIPNTTFAVPREYGSFFQDPAIIRLLISRGVNPLIKNRFNETAREKAIQIRTDYKLKKMHKVSSRMIENNDNINLIQILEKAEIAIENQKSEQNKAAEMQKEINQLRKQIDDLTAELENLHKDMAAMVQCY